MAQTFNFETEKGINEVNAVEMIKASDAILTVGEEKPYKLGRLKPDNIFTCVTILNEIGFKEIKQIISPENIKAVTKAAKAAKEGNDKEETNKVTAIEKIGFDIFMDVAGIIVSNLERCKSSLYRLLSDISDLTVEQIRDLDAAVFIQMIMDVFSQDNFKDFFKVVLKFFK